MKKLFFIAVLFWSFGFCVIEAQEQAQPAQQYTPAQYRQAVKNILAILNVKQNVMNAIAQVKEMQLEGMSPQQRQKFEDFYDRYFSWEQIEPDIIAAYQETYSMEELAWMCKFYQSPFGKKQLQSSNLVSKKVEDAIRQRMEQNGGEFKALYKQVLSEEIKKAQQQRAPKGGSRN